MSEKRAYVVYTSSGSCLIGYSDGPSGNLIKLEMPLRYTESPRQQKDGRVAIDFAVIRMSHAMRFNQAHVRWDAVIGPDDMTPAAQDRLLELIEDSFKRFAMQEAGLVDPKSSPPAAAIDAAQRRLTLHK